MEGGRKPIFVECKPCGERWKIGTLPMDVAAMSQFARRVTCPNCAERKDIFICATDGPNKVTAARDGRPV